MSTGNPQFGLQPAFSKEGEKKESVREVQWEQKRKELDEVADAYGRGIEEGIIDTIVAFNISGIPTSASCEGHPEFNGGHRPWPWVEVSAPNEPKERFIGEREIFEDIARVNNVPIEELRRGHPEELFWEVQRKRSQNPETAEYQEWEKRNKELHIKVTKLLVEFYKNRESDPDIQLQAERSEGGSFEVSSERMSVVRFMDNDLTKEERKKLLALLSQRQREMRDFTNFLKTRFLASS